MENKKNIVFVGFFPGFGGAEKALISIANGLVSNGIEVTIVALGINNIVYTVDKRVSIVPLTDKFKVNILNKFFRFINLFKFLYKIKPDVVFSFWTQPAIYSAIFSKFINFQVVYAERGDPSDSEYTGLLGILRKFFFNRIDYFVFQTKGAQQYFPSTIQNKSIIINNPVQIAYEEYPIPDYRNNVIVNVGRLHSQKNQMLLIDAFEKLVDEYPNYTLEIFGEGELRVEIEDHIANKGLQKSVKLKGTTNNLFEEIYHSKMFVLSSDYEGMPNALMEAMAIGLPSISTDCKPGGAREIIQNGVNGLIVERGNADSLYRAMKYYIENPLIADKFAEKGKEISNTHSFDKIIERWSECINNLTERKL